MSFKKLEKLDETEFPLVLVHYHTLFHTSLQPSMRITGEL